MMKKITIAIPLEQVETISALMAETKFVENDRIAAGGTMSAPITLITYYGEESDFKPDHYVEKKHGQMSTYYSLHVPDGYTTNDFQKFVDMHNSRGQDKIEVKRIPKPE